MDMLKVAHILKGKTVHPDVSLSIAPGSKQVLNMLALNGARLGSKKMLAATVAAYTHGRLTEYAGEIEQYYEPVFDNPAFTLDDDSPCPAADDDTDEYPDDDGRFDAWV